MPDEPHSIMMLYTTTPNNPPPDNFLRPGQMALEVADPKRLTVGVPPAISANGKVVLIDTGADMPAALGGQPATWRPGYFWYDGVNATLELNTGTEAAPVLTPVGGTTYIDARVAPALMAAQNAQTTANGAMPKGGGTFTGPITLAADPTANLQPATKQYADAFMPKSGGTFTGLVTLSGAPVTNLDAATKQYVDGGDALAMPKVGGTFTGAITLVGDPVQALQPATKQYVDGIGTTATNAMPKSGGTFIGNVLMANSAVLQPAADKGVGLGTTALHWANVYGDVLNVGGGNIPIRSGSGSPETVVTAPVGSLYLRNDGGVGTTLYSKQTGAGNTGWAALSSADLTPAIQAAMSAEDNLLINGDFRIQQRGTSFGPVTAAVVFTVDGWRIYAGTGSTISSTVTSFSLGQVVASDHPRFALGANRTTTGTGAMQFLHRLEDVRTAEGQTVTVSFLAYGPVATSVLNVSFSQFFGTGGSPSAQVNTTPVTFSINSANTWEQKTITLALPGISGKTLGTNNDHYLQLVLEIPTSLGNGTWTFADFDLRLGSVAPPQFLRRPYQQEMALCQRYYQYHRELAITGYAGAGGQVLYMPLLFPVEMRTTPTAVLDTINYSNSSAYSAGRLLPDQVRVQTTATAIGGVFSWANVALSAEL